MHLTGPHCSTVPKCLLDIGENMLRVRTELLQPGCLIRLRNIPILYSQAAGVQFWADRVIYFVSVNIACNE